MITQICLDMDGVLCDFVSAALAAHGRDPKTIMRLWPRGRYPMEPLLNVTTAKFWEAINLGGLKFWEELEPLPWCELLYTRCRELAPTVVLTRPSADWSSIAGKVRWLRRHLAAGADDFLMGASKHFCAKPGAVLIDDCDANCDKFVEHGGRAIVFPQVWNSQHKEADDPLGYVLSMLHALRIADESAAGALAYGHQINAGGRRATG